MDVNLCQDTGLEVICYTVIGNGDNGLGSEPMLLLHFPSILCVIDGIALDMKPGGEGSEGMNSSFSLAQ